MSPLKKAARHLTKQLESASPEVQAAGERVLLSLTIYLNSMKDHDALRFAIDALQTDMHSLETAWRAQS